jgi:hypothetical protein
MSCPHESNVLHAAAADRWSDALRRHAADCADCAAAAAAAPWMTRFARISDREHLLPDPSVVWLKAQVLRGAADVARVSRPISIAQLFAYFAVAAGWAAVLTWKWNVLETWITSFTRQGLVTTAARAESLSLSMLMVVFVLAATTVMLALHTILAED